jgi:hypothetical protein
MVLAPVIRALRSGATSLRDIAHGLNSQGHPYRYGKGMGCFTGIEGNEPAVKSREATKPAKQVASQVSGD